MDIEVVSHPLKQDTDSVLDGIKEYNAPHFPDQDLIPLSVFVRDSQNEVIAGLNAELFTTSLMINHLWVSSDLRGNDVGTKLIAKAESEALARGVTDIYLDTYSFQALGFYQKLGFKVVGEFSDYPIKGVHKHFLQKSL